MDNQHDYEDEAIDEESEFWFFTDPSPLPALDLISETMTKAYPCFILDSRGGISNLKDNMANGTIIAPDDIGQSKAEGVATAWMIEVLDAKKVFSRSPRILKDLGPNTQMLRVSLADDLSLGHAFSMLYAMLTLRGGLLAIPAPESNDVTVLNKSEALAALKEELDSLDIEVDFVDDDK